MGQIQTWWDRFQLGGADSNIVGQISTYWNLFQRGGADSNLMGHIPTWWDISQQSNIVGQFSTNGNVFQRGETYFKVVEVGTYSFLCYGTDSNLGSFSKHMFAICMKIYTY